MSSNRMNSGKKYKKSSNTKKQPIVFDSENGTCNFNGYKKHIIENPNLGSENIEKTDSSMLNENSFSETEGKYVSVDRLRLENINNMLQYLNKEFQELSKSNPNESRPITEVRSSYYQQHNIETLKKIQELSDK